MFRRSGGKCFGIKLLSTMPPDFYQSGGFWQFAFLFWQFIYVILILQHLQSVAGKCIS